MNIQKNQEYTVEIIDNGYEGEGIAKIEGKENGVEFKFVIITKPEVNVKKYKGLNGKDLGRPELPSCPGL